jgi:hypothetical protein
MDSDDIKGMQSFKKPTWFTDELSNCYSVIHSEDEDDFFEDVNANIDPEVRNAKVKCEENMRHRQFAWTDVRRWYSDSNLIRGIKDGK